jgi:tyrosyl-tRNA synthetase
MAGIRSIFSKFLEFGDGPSDAIMVNNADWLDELRYIPLLRDVGRHFSVNRMLTLDSVRLRLERDQPLSFLEFNYPILQAYDFGELARRYQCELQIGGSDQWGNIVAGVELARRAEGRTLFGLTTPLLTTASGIKMGKTAQGAVWLNGERLSPYEYWQFWRNTEDDDVGRFLRLFTELDIDTIQQLNDGDINEAKKVLATEATALCHGQAAAEEAAGTARVIFGRGRGVLLGISASGSASTLPQTVVPRDLLARGIPAFELFSRAGLAASNSEARRLIRGGGARINDTVVESETRPVSLADLDPQGMLKLSAGRKRHALVRPV